MNGNVTSVKVQYVDNKKIRWYVMRDLKRQNDKSPAHKVLKEMGLEVFTPLIEKINVKRGMRVRENVPYLPDLLFVRASRNVLDPIVERIPTLQYRFKRGGRYQEPIFVDDLAMGCFMQAVEHCLQTKYYLPMEISAMSVGTRIRIIGGGLNNVEGTLLKIKGTKKRRIIVEIQGFLAAMVEVEPEYIQLIE